MNTYLIFFGKSQDFTFHAFDENSYIQDFDNVFKDFSLLESDIFSIDDINNKNILSKYCFTNAAQKPFTLLKLYSFAQAYQGARIGNSIYGVGILSQNDLKFSKHNIELLKVTKEGFAKLCLNGLKFKSNEFKIEAERIWEAVKNDGSFRFDFTNKPISFDRRNTRAYCVESLDKSPISMDKDIQNLGKVYLSEDLEHLKRANSKWGNNVFPIYTVQKGKYKPYEKPQEPPLPPTPPVPLFNTPSISNRLNEEATNGVKKVLKVTLQILNENMIKNFFFSPLLPSSFFVLP
jgi:hypothetical protein